MTCLRRVAPITFSLVLCACGALLGDAFDGLQPADATDAATPAADGASGEAGADASLDSSADAPDSIDARDGAGSTDADLSPNWWDP